jgi:chromosome segregation ATPase
VKVAHFQLQRVLKTIEGLSGHVNALDHTLRELHAQVTSAQGDIAVLRADLEELRTEVGIAVARVETILAGRSEAE